MTITEVFKYWAKGKQRQVKESSFSNYYHHYIRHILPNFGSMDVASIDKHIVRDFVYKQLEVNASKTVKDILILLKMIMKYAAEEFDIAIHSLEWGIVWPSSNIENHKIERYTPKQVRMILDYAFENPSNAALATIIALTTGMRIGEICALKFSDIDLANGIIHITRTVERIMCVPREGETVEKKTKIIESSPKTKSSRRDVPMTPKLKKLIKAFMSVARPDYYVASGNNKLCEPRILRCQSARLVRRSGVETVLKFHAFRHTFASTLIEQKIDPKTVSSILGHSDVSITLNLYVHPSDDAKKNAVTRGLKGLLD